MLVCLDAGIATDDNLAGTKLRGYDYMCVSRSRMRRTTSWKRVRRETELNKKRKHGEKLRHNVTSYRTEIVRRMSTQKAVLTEAVNALWYTVKQTSLRKLW